MKKSVAFLTGVVLVGGGAWLGGAWYTGTRLETISSDQVAQFNADLEKAMPDADVSVRQLSFERGWFASQARYALSFAVDDEDVTLEFDTRYEHGPFPMGALAHGQFAPMMTFVRSSLARSAEGADLFDVAQGDAPPIWAEALISYAGNADYRGGISAIKFDDEGSAVDFKGASLQGIYKHATHHVTGALNAPGMVLSGIEATAEPLEFALTDVQLDLDLAKGRFDNYVGDVELRVARMSIAQPTRGSHFAVDNLTYGGTSSEDEHFLKGDVYLRGKALTLNDFGLGDLSMIFKGDQLDGASLKRMRDTIQALAVEAGGSDSIDPKRMSHAVAQDLQTFLGNNPRLAIAPLSWKNGKGESTLDVRTEFANPKDFDVPGALLAARLLKAVNIDLRLHKSMVTELAATLLRLTQGMDATLASAVVQQQYDALASHLVQIGLAKAEGEHLASTLHYDGEHEKITINDREVSLSELMGLVMML